MKNRLQIRRAGIFTWLLFLGLVGSCAVDQQGEDTLPAEISELMISPSATDSRISAEDDPHLVMYDPRAPQGKLLLFLPGTNGVPEWGPKELFKAAIEQGYRVINLSYNNKIAVARICRGENLEADSDCTEKFRTQRVFGDQLMTFIPDQPHDAILNRFEKLLTHLDSTDEDGHWDAYLEDGQPNWSNITVTGQSQGGGMAAFIAKKITVNRVITFSGGWDFSAPEKIAKWYYNDSVTPADRWYGVYHSQEPMAQTIDETYRAMDIPEARIFSLNRDIREGKKAHSEGIRNTTYSDMWEMLFADGSLLIRDQ